MNKHTIIALASVLCAGSHLLAWDETSNPFTFSGKVGVGTNSPQQQLHVNNGRLLITDDTNTYLMIKSTVNDKDPAIILYDYQDENWRFILDESDNNKLGFRWNNSGRMWLETNGNLRVDGNLKTDGKSLFFDDRMRLVGEGNSSEDLNFYSDSSESAGFKFYADTSTTSSVFMGDIRGFTSGSIFGLRDADFNWIIKSVKDDSISFSIDGDEKMKIEDDGEVTINGSATIYGPVTIDDEVTIARIPAQGDISMGDFTE